MNHAWTMKVWVGKLWLLLQDSVNFNFRQKQRKPSKQN